MQLLPLLPGGNRCIDEYLPVSDCCAVDGLERGRRGSWNWHQLDECCRRDHQVAIPACILSSHLMGMFYRTIRMMENGIKPVYVFDGKPPELKGKEVP